MGTRWMAVPLPAVPAGTTVVHAALRDGQVVLTLESAEWDGIVDEVALEPDRWVEAPKAKRSTK